MYGGRIVEHGATAEVLARPQHSYTASLRAAAAAIEDGRTEAKVP
jgi:ABC-type dipeptide/oligopeptide/nickel transport system ATPase component